MSFTGIFKAKNGIVAVVDSKASREMGDLMKTFTEIQKSSLYSKTELQQLFVLTRS